MLNLGNRQERNTILCRILKLWKHDQTGQTVSFSPTFHLAFGYTSSKQLLMTAFLRGYIFKGLFKGISQALQLINECVWGLHFTELRSPIKNCKLWLFSLICTLLMVGLYWDVPPFHFLTYELYTSNKGLTIKRQQGNTDVHLASKAKALWKPQNHRVDEVGRDFWRPFWTSPLLRQQHQDSKTSSRQPVPLLPSWNPPYFNLCPLTPALICPIATPNVSRTNISAVISTAIFCTIICKRMQ